ncbi:MAG: amino acid ABC transporter permease [Clostridiales bacterium]|jgi:putative lysine transport system permease protein|nr:amino acid ABC transporter permease [Clostridiales bacterium]
MTWKWFVKIIVEYWPMFLRGAGVTLYISIIGTILGAIIGLIIGTIRTIPLSENPVKRILIKIVNIILTVYVEVFRGTPMIVQAMVIYYGSLMLFNINMDKMFAGIFIVSINTGAYTSEIVRGGIISIDRGQFEAAHALGMNHVKTMLYVVLPQVVRNILPAMGNEFVINIKDSSVLNVISVSELFFQTSSITGNVFRFFEPFLIACIVYLIMTLTVTRILRFIEKKMDGPENFNVIPGNQMQVTRPEDIAKKTGQTGY